MYYCLSGYHTFLASRIKPKAVESEVAAWLQVTYSLNLLRGLAIGLNMSKNWSIFPFSISPNNSDDKGNKKVDSPQLLQSNDDKVDT